jgi:hypothetical protein
MGLIIFSALMFFKFLSITISFYAQEEKDFDKWIDKWFQENTVTY